MIGAEQRTGTRRVEFAGAVEAPVVGRDGEVEEQVVDAGEVEVEEAADALAVEEDVVAEEVGVDDAARQVADLAAAVAALLRLEADLLAQQRRVLGIEQRQQLRRRRPSPGGAARVVLAAAAGLGGDMQVAEQRAERGAVRDTGLLERAAGQPRDDQCRLAGDLADRLVVAVGDRRRAGQAVAREVGHQVHEERQLVAGELLEHRQHVAAVGGVEEEVGVLHALGDAFQALDRAEGIALQPGGDLLVGEGSEYGHGQWWGSCAPLTGFRRCG